MKKNKNKGYIYKVECKITGEVYIGATSDSIENRIKDHFQKANSKKGYKLHKAIMTYGPDAFIWEEVDTASNLNELADKEKAYIINYNSKKDGYNTDSGGGFNKRVFQYDLNNGSLINSFDSLDDASSTVNATTKQISRACLSVNKEYGGCYWSYTYKEPFEPEKDHRKKSVYQLDKEYNLVGEYSSVSEASKETGINKTSIAKVCRGERNHAGGYNWIYN